MGIPDEFWIGFVIMVGFFLKLVYVIHLGFTSGTLNPGAWSDLTAGQFSGGHLEVIHYLFTFHRLPSFSPVGLPGYADPPFYYIICSLVLEIFHRMMGWSIGVSLYVLLLMNVIFVMVGECCAIGILQKFGVRGRKLVVGILFLIFFPTFYHLSGALDGSALAFMLSMLGMNSALAWFGSRRKKVLTRTAVHLGLGLLTSYAVFAVIPAVFVLLRFAVSDGRRNQTPLRIQYRNFGIITGILGFIWPVSLSIRFRLPLFYVEKTGVPAVGSALGRLLMPGTGALFQLHMTGVAANESSIPGQTLKTAIMDFHAINISARGTYMISVFLLCLSIAICVMAHIMLLYTILSQTRIDRMQRRFLTAGYLIPVTGYVILCFLIPYTGTMNFKLFAPLLIFPVAGISICGSGDLSDNVFEKAATGIINVMILVLAFITAFLFGFYA